MTLLDSYMFYYYCCLYMFLSFDNTILNVYPTIFIAYKLLICYELFIAYSFIIGYYVNLVLLGISELSLDRNARLEGRD